jgi:TPR repeat protein
MHKPSRVLRLVIVLCLTAGAVSSAMGAPLDYIDQALTRGDYRGALAVLLPRAAAGEPEAEYRLSLLYESGTGVPQNFALQAKWCRDAAEQDYAPAQLSLARLYLRGRGVAPDRVASYVWANLAASRFSPGPRLDEARRFRDVARQKLLWEEIDPAQQMATSWRPRNATADWSPIPLTATR